MTIAITAIYFTFSCAGVGAWEEYGEKLQILTLVLEMIIPPHGVRVLSMMLTSVDHPVIINIVTQPPSQLIIDKWLTKEYVAG